MATAKFTDYYKPMLATLVDEAFDHKDWIFELKLDGYRAVAEVSKKACGYQPCSPVEKRGNNIYIDYLQNRKGQTLAAVYSLRPKKGATVSTPLEWKEVKKGLHPSQFDMFNIFKRLEKKGDLFIGVLEKNIDLKKCSNKLIS